MRVRDDFREEWTKEYLLVRFLREEAFSPAQFLRMKRQGGKTLVPGTFLQLNGRPAVIYDLRGLVRADRALAGEGQPGLDRLTRELPEYLEYLRKHGFSPRNLKAFPEGMYRTPAGTLQMICLPVGTEAGDDGNRDWDDWRRKAELAIVKEALTLSQRPAVFLRDAPKSGQQIPGSEGENWICEMKTGIKTVLDQAALMIGRTQSQERTLVISDQAVGRGHCRILPEGSGYFLEDLGSVNGTLLDGEAVPSRQKVKLRDGMVLGVAGHRFMVHISDGRDDQPAGSADEAHILMTGPDEAYLLRCALFLVGASGTKTELEIISERSLLEDRLDQRSGPGPQMIFTGWDKETLPISGMVFALEKSLPEDEAASIILREVRKILWTSRIQKAKDPGALKEKSRLIAVYSPQGGCGKTVIALNLARKLAQQGRRVFYADLVGIRDFDLLLPPARDRQPGNDLGQIRDAGDAAGKAQRIPGQDGFFCVLPPDNPLDDAGRSVEDREDDFFALRDTVQYDVLIADTDTSFGREKEKLLIEADVVCLVAGTDRRDRLRLERLTRCLNLREREKYFLVENSFRDGTEGFGKADKGQIPFALQFRLNYIPSLERNLWKLQEDRGFCEMAECLSLIFT